MRVSRFRANLQCHPQESYKAKEAEMMQKSEAAWKEFQRARGEWAGAAYGRQLLGPELNASHACVWCMQHPCPALPHSHACTHAHAL